jgi:hypothetical protein
MTGRIAFFLAKDVRRMRAAADEEKERMLRNLLHGMSVPSNQVHDPPRFEPIPSPFRADNPELPVAFLWQERVNFSQALRFRWVLIGMDRASTSRSFLHMPQKWSFACSMVPVGES